MLPIFHLSIERWRKNKEYGVYVSNFGRIRTLRTKEDLNIRINDSGYSIVFTDKGAEFVHRLVAYTWLGEKRNDSYNIDHINNNKRDNSVKNLRWVEKQVNTEYSSYVLAHNSITVTEKEQPKPIQAVEKDEDLIQNSQVPAQKRVAAMKRLLDNNDGLLEIYKSKNDELVTTFSSFTEARHYITIEAKIAYNGTQDNFNQKIMSALAMKKAYMTFNWKYRKVK